MPSPIIMAVSISVNVKPLGPRQFPAGRPVLPTQDLGRR
jgi:hypothetical protein